MELGEGIKKILLAGIGTAAVTAEKSKEVLDELVKKGELTVEQGKVLNQELKHNIKESVKKNVNVTLKPSNPDELKEVIPVITGMGDIKHWPYPVTEQMLTEAFDELECRVKE